LIFILNFLPLHKQFSVFDFFMDRSICRNGHRLPDLPQGIFVAGQICSESKPHFFDHSIFWDFQEFLIEADFVFLHDRCMLSSGFPHFSPGPFRQGDFHQRILFLFAEDKSDGRLLIFQLF